MSKPKSTDLVKDILTKSLELQTLLYTENINLLSTKDNKVEIIKELSPLDNKILNYGKIAIIENALNKYTMKSNIHIKTFENGDFVVTNYDKWYKNLFDRYSLELPDNISVDEFKEIFNDTVAKNYYDLLSNEKINEHINKEEDN